MISKVSSPIERQILLPLLTWTKNREHRFTQCCGSLIEAADMTSLSEMLGKTDDDMLWKARASEYRVGEIEALSGKTSCLYQWVKTQKGERRLINKKSPLMNECGDIIGIIGTSVDVTDHLVLDKIGQFDENGHLHLYYLNANVVLTKHEVKVLHYLLQGKSAEAIGECLYRSKRTIEGHILSIRGKLQCKTKGDIIYRAHELGLIFLCYSP